MFFGLGDLQARKTKIWGYLKNFQNEMQARERIPTSIVENFKDTIFFMVDID